MNNFCKMNKINYFLVSVIIVLLISNVFLYSKINRLEKDKENLSKNNLILSEEKIKADESHRILVQEFDNLRMQIQKSNLEQSLTPEETVKKFVEADMAGARIGGTILDVKKYISFVYEGDQAMIIKSYEIINGEIANDKAKVMVKYICAGGGYEFSDKGDPVGVKSCDSYFKENNEYSSQAEKIGITVDKKNNAEIIVFNLEKINNQWKITSPSIPLHISIETFLNHTKTLLINSADIDKFNKFFAK